MEKTKTFLLTGIPEEAWVKFVNKIPRNKTINEKITEMILEESER